jgi:pyruvate/2-oxoglutarate dehydrogenase complex dihydrolipoamide acyltransferase (E2) component
MASVPIVVPQLGTVAEVFVVEWLCADGDDVKAGEPVVTIESEKATTDIAAPASGRLEVIVAADEDVEVAVGTVLGAVHRP